MRRWESRLNELAGFQKMFQPPPDIAVEEAPRPGFGEGGFVVVRTVKTSLS